MKKLLLVSVFIALFASSNAFAEVFTGKVINSEDNSPLEGATVRVDNRDIATKTDADGTFQINGISGDITITVSHIGFSKQKGISLKPGEKKLITLIPTPTTLDAIVVTANRYEKAAYKVAQPITVTKQEEIQAKGYTIVSDVIRSFPGVDMNDAGPFRSRPVIRGLFGTRLLVLVDGERLNDQRDIVDFAGVSMSLVDPNEIDRIEVVNGPSSVLYGSDAMGGVINIITKKNNFSDKLKPWAQYSSRYSTVDEHSSNRLDIGLSSEKITFSGGYQHRQATRDYKLPDDYLNEDSRYSVYRPEFYDSLNAVQGTSFSSDRLVNSKVHINNYDAKFGYKFNNHHSINADLGFFRATDIGFPGVPNDSTPFLFAWPKHERDNFSVTYTGKSLSNKMAKMEAKFYYDKISKDFFTDFYDNVSFPAGPGATGYIENSLSKTKVEKLGLNFQELYQLHDNVTLTFGFDSWRESISGDVRTITRFEGFGPQPVYDTSTSASVPKNRWVSLGTYVSSETHLDNLTVEAGVRWDNFWVKTEETPGYVDDEGNLLPTVDETYSSLNGSLGLIYPLGKGINAVASVGSAYRVPNVVERFFYGSASGRLTRPNPDIKPERAVTVDGGIKAVHPHISYSFIGFYSDYSDFSQLRSFGQDTLTMRPLWRFENMEDVTIYGFEALIEGRLDNGLYGSFSFAYQHGENKTEDGPLFVSPIKTTLTTGYRYKKYGLFGELSIRRLEDQNRVPTTSTLDDIPTKGYTVVNFNTGVRLFDSIRLSISANNLFDVTYSEPFNARNPDNPIPESGRNFIVSFVGDIGR